MSHLRRIAVDDENDDDWGEFLNVIAEELTATS